MESSSCLNLQDENTLRLSSGIIVAKNKSCDFISDKDNKKMTLYGKDILKLINELDQLNQHIEKATSLAQEDQHLVTTVYKQIISQFYTNAYILEVSTYEGKCFIFLKRWFVLADSPTIWRPTKTCFKIEQAMIKHIKTFLQKIASPEEPSLHPSL